MPMKKRTLIAIILLMIGVGCVTYPVLSDLKNQHIQDQILTQLERDIGSEPGDKLDENFPVPVDRNSTPPANPTPNNNGIGILTVPKIKLKMPVQEGVSNKVLKHNAGHLPTTAKVGDFGNAVISGHRQYVYGSQFNRLDELEAGDLISYQDISGKQFEFEVFEKVTVTPDDTSIFNYGKAEPTLTLLTCTPIYKGTHRLLVKAKLVVKN